MVLVLAALALLLLAGVLALIGSEVRSTRR